MPGGHHGVVDQVLRGYFECLVRLGSVLIQSGVPGFCGKGRHRGVQSLGNVDWAYVGRWVFRI